MAGQLAVHHRQRVQIGGAVLQGLCFFSDIDVFVAPRPPVRVQFEVEERRHLVEEVEHGHHVVGRGDGGLEQECASWINDESLLVSHHVSQVKKLRFPERGYLTIK